MKTVGASEFKTHCLALLDEVAEGHLELLVLKRGRPVARVLPVAPASPAPQQSLLGTMVARDDLLDPPLAADDWEAEVP